MYCWLVTKSCLTLVIPRTIACQAPLSKGFPRKKILEWVAISFSRALSWLQGIDSIPPTDLTHIFWLSGGFFHWATWESPLYVYLNIFCRILNPPVVVNFRHDSQCPPGPGIHALMTLLPMCHRAYWLAYNKKYLAKVMMITSKISF